MTHSSWLWDIVAWLSLPLLAILAGVIGKTRRYKEFPFFFGYVLIACLLGIIRFVVYKEVSQRIYFYTYWSSGFFGDLASLLAIYEVFVHRTFPKFANVRFYRKLFPLAAAAIIVLGFLTALSSPNEAAAFFMASRMFDFLRTALIAFFVFLVLVMGRKFPRKEFYIALGFGIQAAFSLINATLTTRIAYKTDVLARFEPAVFDLACIIWLWTFLYYRKPPGFQNTDEIQPELLQQARTWETVLKKWLGSKKNVV